MTTDDSQQCMRIFGERTLSTSCEMCGRYLGFSKQRKVETETDISTKGVGERKEGGGEEERKIPYAFPYPPPPCPLLDAHQQQGPCARGSTTVTDAKG